MTHHGFCLWLTGLPSAGKTTIGRALVPKLQARGWNVELLDGDEIRMGLSSDLGFDRKAREMHAARVTYVAKVLARNGVIPIVTLISPYATSRAKARADIGQFIEVYITTPLNVCEERDVKGLYKKAREGKIKEMTGIDDPYEAPENPEIRIETVTQSAEQAADQILADLERRGLITPPEKPRAQAH
ncbi:MAG: adenylyl-sulfate kinase [Thermoplasmata archaeon]|nr:adenylyl-sulfate kinase [Thermoplasmata archaeon]